MVVRSDTKPSTLTTALYKTLYLLSYSTTTFVFGHEEDNYSGQHWTDSSGKRFKSDIYDATGSYPLLVGFNFQDIIDNIDDHKVDYQAHIKSVKEMGGFVQIMWDAYNPVDIGGTHDCTGNPITALLPGGSANAQWTSWLDTIADFMLDTRDDQGDVIPFVFRLFHENTGHWYWWSSKCASPEEYKAAWRYTVRYLRDSKGLHNALYIYCPSDPYEYFQSAFNLSWPGDEWVDIIGFDKYTTTQDYSEDVADDCHAVQQVALEKNLPFAIGETGVSDGLNNTGVAADFFGTIMQKTMAEHCTHAAFALTWANYDKEKYWTPIKGEPTYDGFVTLMTESDGVMMRGSAAYEQAATVTGFTSKQALNKDLYPDCCH